jgi:hypothetical protein
MELPRICGRAHPSLWVSHPCLLRAPVPARRSRLWLLLRSTSCIHAVVGVLFQQALALEAAADALADQLNQLLQLGFVWCLDALKSGWSIVAIHIDAIQEQDMKMYKVN